MPEKDLSLRPEPRTHIALMYEDTDIVVHFVGDHACTRYSEIIPHTNPGFEICLIPYGKGFFRIRSQTYPIEGSQLFITKAPQEHAGWPSKETPYRILYICFRIKESSPDAAWIELKESLDKVAFPLCQDLYRMEELFNRLIAEARCRHSYSDNMINSLVKQISILTVRNHESTREEIAQSEEDAGSRLVKSIILYVDENINRTINLDHLSSSLNYSKAYLCRHFKHQTGFTVMEYFNLSRLERARKLLLKSDESISELAGKFGFKTIHHFSSLFKDIYGMSPSSYRKKHTGEQTQTE